MSATRIAPLALYQEVAERLRQRIFSHEFEEGSWIDEQAIARQYGISRTPLREALKVLAAEGLVTLKPRRGCYVTEVSERDLDEVFAVMSVLEGECARLCADNASNAELAELEDIHLRLEAAAATQDIEGFFDANQAFHEGIQNLAGNRWMANVLADLRKVIKLSRHHSLLSAGRMAQSLAEHREIMQSLRARDSAAAQTLMHRHLQSGRAALARIPRAKARAA